jgi:hypothetical protein
MSRVITAEHGEKTVRTDRNSDEVDEHSPPPNFDDDASVLAVVDFNVGHTLTLGECEQLLRLANNKKDSA